MTSEVRSAAGFATTQWSIVVRAARPEESAARWALEQLCQRYWLPLYAFARRRVATVHEAQDLTQEFFVRLLEKNSLAAASPERGRFRSFLLASFKNFLANEWDRAAAQKRGGGRERLSLDWESGESRLSLEPVHTDTPEREFERQWILTLLDNVVRRLEDEFASTGKARQFELLKETLTGGRAVINYTAVAAELSISEEAARQTAHRLRRRYRELLREEVAATVESDAELEDEIGRLLSSLGT